MRKLYYGLMRDYHFAKASEALFEAGKVLPKRDTDEYFVWMGIYRKHINKFCDYCKLA